MTPQERARDARLKKLYGISSIEYEQILAWQGGVCAICGRPPKSRRLHVDHDHSTGYVRGLTCFPCNSGLRRTMTVARAYRIAEYLDHHPSLQALGRQPVGTVGRITKKRRRKRDPRRR